MLAMLSCVFSERWDPSNTTHDILAQPELDDPYSSDTTHSQHVSGIRNYHPSERIARAVLRKPDSTKSTIADYQKVNDEVHSVDSSTGVPFGDMSASSTPPSYSRPILATLERRDSLATSLSTSPEQMRHNHRSSPSLSTLGASVSRPLTFNSSIASSPPAQYPRKRLSPAGSYLGVSTSTNSWSPSQFFARSSSTIMEDPKSSFNVSVSDTEEDAQPIVEKPVFTTRLKNQEQFHNEGYADLALLDAQEEWRYHAYREAYAHLLYIWGLSITRTEILKYNGVLTSRSTCSNEDSTSDLAIGTAGTFISTGVRCLDFRDHCQKCNTLLSSKHAGRRCPNCANTQTSLLCLLCNTFVRGLSSPCLICGHVLHSSCRELLLSQSPGDVPSECISGCGCQCADYFSIEVKAMDPIARTLHEDVSPAVTVVGDTTTGEREQLEWYDNSEWEDMAYESLARNLKPKQGVKAKSSQIWKRRTGST